MAPVVGDQLLSSFLLVAEHASHDLLGTEQGLMTLDRKPRLKSLFAKLTRPLLAVDELVCFNCAESTKLITA